MLSLTKMFFFFLPMKTRAKNMIKPASKVAKSAQIQPKSQFLFHKNLPPRDFSIMTLCTLDLVVTSSEYVKDFLNMTK